MDYSVDCVMLIQLHNTSPTAEAPPAGLVLVFELFINALFSTTTRHNLFELFLAYVGRFGHLLNTFPVSRAISLPLVIGLCETGGSRPPCNPTQFPLEDPSHDSLVSFYR